MAWPHMHGRRGAAMLPNTLLCQFTPLFSPKSKHLSVSQSVSHSTVSAAGGKTTRLTPGGIRRRRRKFTQLSACARLRGFRACTRTAVLRQLKQQFQSQEDRKQLEQHFVYTSSSSSSIVPSIRPEARSLHGGTRILAFLHGRNERTE